MTREQGDSGWSEPTPTALLVLADGTVLEGLGFGAAGRAVGEVCFNTAMTGYEEILTDPSYAGQIITFTFPHIGNVGTNEEDIETVNLAATPGARGVVLHSGVTAPSNYRATRHLDAWLKSRGVVGLAGIDTRALTALIREKGMPNAVIAHEPSGRFDLEALKREAREWPGMVGMDLVPMVTTAQRFTWDETPWRWGEGYGRRDGARVPRRRHRLRHQAQHSAPARRQCLQGDGGAGADLGRRHSVTQARRHFSLQRPRRSGRHRRIRRAGDPRADRARCRLSASASAIRCWRSRSAPRPIKMHQGHHGANHPVKDLLTGKVEITSMNHGFAVDRASLPANAAETHVSLFDGSNCGLGA